MHKKAAALAAIFVVLSVVGAIPAACGAPTMGVKKGDWIQYNVDITGTPPPIHDVTWMRMVILQIQGAAFQANITVRFVNGTLYSSIWKFNFTEGNEEGWIIIPSNLGPGETFYDFSKPANIAIQGQEQKTVVGASRTVTYANDSFGVKKWDKATGVFIQSSENFGNWSAYVSAIATNMWSPQILGLDQTAFFTVITVVIVAAVVIITLAIAIRHRKPAHNEKTYL